MPFVILHKVYISWSQVDALSFTLTLGLLYLKLGLTYYIHLATYATSASFKTAKTLRMARGHAIHSILNLSNSGQWRGSEGGEGAINLGLSLISQEAVFSFQPHSDIGGKGVNNIL